jgi:UDP-GlcNAc:undecaprenyl-phosphate GlcNAc-1-phosphate transferase
MLLSGVLFDVAFTLVRRTLAGRPPTHAHRGHLYQVAHRSGMSAVRVALVHWLFCVLGGIACLAFIAAPSAWKPFVPLVLLLPQLVWLAAVARLARGASPDPWV